MNHYEYMVCYHCIVYHYCIVMGIVDYYHTWELLHEAVRRLEWDEVETWRLAA